MALRNQPYIPLYVDDFANDEKLKECSASAVGVYVYIMCVMHKSEPYGKVLLKQKYKTDSDIIKCFASQLIKQMPFDFHTVMKSLAELLHEKVLAIEGDMLIQKRMVKDNDLSETRSRAGKNGGNKTKTYFALANPQANSTANPVIENGTVTEDETNKKRYEIFKEQCLTHERWQNDLCIACKIEMRDIPEIIDSYIAHLGAGDVVHGTLRDFKQHIRNWLLAKPAAKNGTRYTPKILT